MLGRGRSRDHECNHVHNVISGGHSVTDTSGGYVGWRIDDGRRYLNGNHAFLEVRARTARVEEVDMRPTMVSLNTDNLGI